MRRNNYKTILLSKFKESLASVIPIACIVLLLCFTITPIPTDLLLMFVFGVSLLILGMALFTLGVDISMSPTGEYIGSYVAKKRNIWFLILMCFLVGTIVTISEPDLQVLAEQVPNIPNQVIVFTVAAGVGLFLVMAVVRIFFKLKLAHMLIFFYLIVFGLTAFVPSSFIAVAFDSGGVTTGPMTVPFIMAMGVGISHIRSDKDAESDSFGLVALCSIGPILAVMLLGIFYPKEGGAYTPVKIPSLDNSRDMFLTFVKALPDYILEVSMALLPIVALFFLFQIFCLRRTRQEVVRITVGYFYTFLGLVLFLTAANIGFMPIGNYMGEEIAKLSFNWILIPIGMIIGYFIVAAEPAVHVLNKQVYEITSGAIPKKAMSTSLSIGVAVSIGLSMLRIICDVPILYFLIPGYLVAIVLSFFVPSIFTAIAFDSGGVASGPMTAAFLLPLSIGVCSAVGGDVVSSAFGTVAMVAMTPLITIQLLGLAFQIKSKKQEKAPKEEVLVYESEIFEMEESHE